MQLDQLRTLPSEETGEAASNKPRETEGAIQNATQSLPDERGSQGGTPETTLAPPRLRRPFALPPWPTSQPGPRITAPSPGQRLVPRRTDPVMYNSYDRERGLPGLLSPMPTDQEREKHQ